MKDEKLDYFKKKILEHLESLEADKEELKKSLLEAESIAKGGKGLPVGTVRDWKGKKYIKVAPGKWKPKYDSHSRGAKLSIAALKRKADECKSSEELLQLVLENRERFSDEMGRPLPFVKELSDYISAKNDELETLPEGRNQKEHYADLKALKRRNAEEYNKKRAEHIRQDIDLNKVTYNQKLLSRKEAEEIIAENKNKKLTNKETSLNANYGSEGAGKLVSQKAVNKSVKNGYTEEEHFTIASHIKELFEEAKLISIEPDRDSDLNDNVKEVRRYATEFDLNGKKGFTLMTVKLNKDETNKMYALELNYLTNKKPATSGEMKDNSNHETLTKDKSRRQQASKNNISHESEKVKENTEYEKGSDVSGNTTDTAETGSSRRNDTATPANTADTSNIQQSSAKAKGLSDIRSKYEASKSVTGNKKTVTLPDGTKIKCHYKIVEAEAPTASHDEVTFLPSKGFPTTKDGKSVNDRDYQNDADAQESVRKIASNFNSLALESPPIVTKDGIVISGNNRTMSSKLAARQGTDKAYLQDLREMADEYGIEPEDLNGFENPRLILETDNEHEGDYTTEEFAQFNRDTKKTMNNVEKAVKLTKTLNAEKIQSIAESLQGYDTMGELYADTKGSQEFVNKLISAGIIGENEKAQYCRTDGTLNDTGKDFCETVLVGGVLNEDNIRKLDGAGGKRIRQKLVRAILPLIENKGTGKEYSFNTELNDAVNIAVTVAKDHETFPDVKTYLSQGNLFGEKEPDAATSRLAEIIHDEGEKAFAQRMKDLGAGLRASASGEQDIFLGGVESKESLLNRFLEIKKSIADILSKLGKREQSASSLVASVLNKIS